jgi:hypothetical protein
LVVGARGGGRGCRRRAGELWGIRGKLRGSKGVCGRGEL